MNTRRKSITDENQKPRNHNRNVPSFSSTLLDEIYRSIDGGNVEKTEPQMKKQSVLRSNVPNPVVEDEKMSSYRRRDCLVEKWMKSDVTEKLVPRRKPPSSSSSLSLSQDNDLLFFSSTSSSSDSSGHLSSSDSEFFGSTTKPKASCFAKRPKPIRTSVQQREERLSFDDYNNKNKSQMGDDLIKSKSRALKIYANLKKIKQPISPGGRLTSFINSLFNNAKDKKSKNVQDLKSSNPPSTTCSSASSYSRSCLSKNSPESRDKMRNGIQRTVRFNVNEGLKTCGHKSTYEENVDIYKRPPLPPTSLSLRGKDSKVEEAAQNVLKGYYREWRDDFLEEEEEDDDDDAKSDCSSDLFELDHLSFYGNSRYCEELPVYETTHLKTNRAIASGLIR